MNNNIDYSQDEVIKNICYFKRAEEILILRRKELNKQILSNRKQKEFWEKFDKTQLKLF